MTFEPDNSEIELEFYFSYESKLYTFAITFSMNFTNTFMVDNGLNEQKCLIPS